MGLIRDNFLKGALLVGSGVVGAQTGNVLDDHLYHMADQSAMHATEAYFYATKAAAEGNQDSIETVDGVQKRMHKAILDKDSLEDSHIFRNTFGLTFPAFAWFGMLMAASRGQRKTVPMPDETVLNELRQRFQEGYREGLKASNAQNIAIYEEVARFLEKDLSEVISYDPHELIQLISSKVRGNIYKNSQN